MGYNPFNNSIEENYKMLKMCFVVERMNRDSKPSGNALVKNEKKESNLGCTQDRMPDFRKWSNYRFSLRGCTETAML